MTTDSQTTARDHLHTFSGLVCLLVSTSHFWRQKETPNSEFPYCMARAWLLAPLSLFRTTTIGIVHTSEAQWYCSRDTNLADDMKFCVLDTLDMNTASHCLVPCPFLWQVFLTCNPGFKYTPNVRVAVVSSYCLYHRAKQVFVYSGMSRKRNSDKKRFDVATVLPRPLAHEYDLASWFARLSAVSSREYMLQLTPSDPHIDAQAKIQHTSS